MAIKRTKARRRTKQRPKKHTVNVTVRGKKVSYDLYSVVASRGEMIEWKLDKVRPFGIVVKDPESPLSWPVRRVHRVAAKGHRTLLAMVKSDALPGFYPYALCVWVDGTLVIDDPEIIIPPPKGGRGY